MSEFKPQIVQSSPLAAQAQPPSASTGLNLVPYPFDDLSIGTSFTLQLDTVNMKSLRQVTRRRNAKGNRTFVIVVHEAENLVEVARRA